MQRLVLIDGNAILHRAYHALPPLTTRSGKLVNAVYGFTTMLLKIIADLKPEYLAVAFDTAKPTFRQMEYLGYQAQRPKMAEELAGQIEEVHQVLRAFGVSIYEVPGFEADDIIGTLTRQAVQNKREVIIVTGDQDLMQLVGPKTKVYAPVRGLSEAEMFDEKKVIAKFGIVPQQIIDYKGLIGDSSDNYPGVPGVGPKTAVGLLKKYKTLQNIYKHLDQLPEPLARKLTEGKELAELSQKLARIVANIPVKLNLRKCQFRLKNEEKERAAKKLAELGFKSLVARLQQTNERSTKVQKKEEQLRMV